MQHPDSDFHLDPALQAQHPKIKQAIAYWASKRGTRMAPSRAEIDLREAKDILPHLQIFDVMENGKAYRPRLIGTAISKQINEASTGKTFDATSDRPVVQRVLRALQWIVEHKEPLRTFARRTALEGQDYMSHETVFMPLSSDGVTVDMVAIVGVFAPANS